ncbi:tetratricopeptide repeat protein, partial [bacterium]
HWGEAEDASPRLEEAIRRGARDADTWHALGAVRAKLGDSAGAADAYRRVELADPKRVDGRVGIATLALAQRDHAEALRQYDELVKLRPRDSSFALARAYCLARLHRAAEARSALRTAEELGAAPAYVTKIQSLLRSP